MTALALHVQPASGSSSAKRWRRRALAVTLSLVGLAGSLLGAELVFRARADKLGFDPYRRSLSREYVCRGRAESYAAHAHSIYRRAPELPEINADGFHDREWKLERTPGVTRILCLGGSTTEGGNSHGLQGSYPYLLEQVLRERLGTEVEVMNAGISAWNSAEMVAAWFLDLLDYRPDLVVIHEAVNDVEPRKLGGFRRDYSHYRKAFIPEHFDSVSRWLAERSDLWLWLVEPQTPTIADMAVIDSDQVTFDMTKGFLPETLLPYRRNLRSIGESVAAYGGTLAFLTLPYDPRADDENNNTMYRIGIGEHNQVMRDLAAEEGWILCDVANLEHAQPDLWRPYFSDLVHVSPEGNQAKAELLATELIEQGFFERYPRALAAGPTASVIHSD